MLAVIAPLEAVVAFTQLEVGLPRVDIEQSDAAHFFVTIRISVHNNGLMSMPEMSALAFMTLGGHSLFSSTTETIRALDHDASDTLVFSVLINANVALDLADVLLRLLAGEAVGYNLYVSISVTVLVEVTVYEQNLRGTVELY